MEKLDISSKIIIHNSCRVCGNSKLEDIISLGTQYLINFLESSDEKISASPLDLVLCNKNDGGCGLLQLRHTVPGELLYRNFWYKSGVNQTMRDALRDIITKAESLVELDKNDIVIDIGANDGTLLRCYKSREIRTIGFEPAVNLVKEANVGTTDIINDFFNYEKFSEKYDNQKAKIITSIAMFYDLEEPNKFVSDIVRTLDNYGVWIIQMNYLTTMLENNAFDNIVHEHLEYYSLTSLEYLLNKHHLTVFDVELNDVNGGSIRIYVKHQGSKKYTITERVKKTTDYENKICLDTHEPYHQFASRIKLFKEKTHNFIKKQVEDGKKVYAYGASTRGNTLLQFYDLDNKLIEAAVDKNPTKWGKRTSGTNIPIISEEKARLEKPDYFLVLPWYFIDEFRSREKEYLSSGGKFIVPLPNLRVIDLDKEISIV